MFLLFADQNIYTVLPLIHEFKVECLLQQCKVFLPDKVNEHMDAQELCRHLHLALHYDLLDLEVKCVSLCSELKLAEMVEWMSYYDIPDNVQLKVRDKSLHRHELEETDRTITTQIYEHGTEMTNKDFSTLSYEELKLNHFCEVFKESSIKISNSIPQPGTVLNYPTFNTVKSRRNKGKLWGTQSDNRGQFGFGTTAATTSLFCQAKGGIGTITASTSLFNGQASTGGLGTTAGTTGLFGQAKGGIGTITASTSLFNGQASTGGLGTTTATTGLFGQANTAGLGTTTATTCLFGQASTGGLGTNTATTSLFDQASTGGCFGSNSLVQSTGLTVSSTSVNNTTSTAAASTAGASNSPEQTLEKKPNSLKFLQGMRLFYKYLADAHWDMKKEVVQFMRSQMNNLCTKEREIFDLLPERAKHDVKGRLVKEIPDKN